MYFTKIRDYFPSLVKSMQFSNEERISNQNPDFVDSVEIEKRRRYPKRNCSLCDFCDLEYEDGCPEHPLLLLLNKQSPRDVKNKNRAKATIPWPLFIGNSSIKGAGLGVWTYANLPQGLLFGPYEGRVNCDVKLGSESGYGWKVCSYCLTF
ncbi:putative histone-lysine N-methyltransferase PRDM7 [Armadillidium vulgare]|nr:putative histone-lysine N-methyltransferase PRDM7 [Armadillidium vulgare]